MATLKKAMLIEADVGHVWAALADVGAVHTRLARGFVVDTKMESGARVVTFANGLVARELIVTVDAEARRLVWAVVGGRMSHHNGAFQARPEGEGRTHLTWTADILPDELAPAIGRMMDDGMVAMKATLEATRPQPVGRDAKAISGL